MDRTTPAEAAAAGSPPSRRGDWPRVATVVFVAVGTGLRIREYVALRSLWLDEAMLAVNVVERGWRELLQPLWYEQSAPVGFLLVQRGLVNLLGTGEAALRALPFAAGLLLLPASWLLARRLLPPGPAAVTAGLVSLSPSLIRYSVEVKPYSSDALVAVLLVLVAAVVVSRPVSVRGVAAWAAAGAVAVWVSYPAVLVLLGVGSVAAVRAWFRRSWFDGRALAVAGAVWLASFAVLWRVSIGLAARNEFMRQYWAPAFAPARLVDLPGWLLRSVSGVMEQSVGIALGVVGILLVAAGALVAVARGQRTLAALVAAPFAALILASVTRIYPLAGRLALFVVPLMAVLATAPLASRWRPVVRITAVALILMTAGHLDAAIRTVREPTLIAEARPVLEQMRAHARRGDAVWVHDTAVPVFRYYAARLGLSADAATSWGDCGRLRAPKARRLWFVYAYRLSTRPPQEHRRLRETLDGFGPRIESFRATRASATLYRVRRRTAEACLQRQPYDELPATLPLPAPD